MNIHMILRFFLIFMGITGLPVIALGGLNNMAIQNVVKDLKGKIATRGTLVVVLSKGRDRPENEQVYLLNSEYSRQLGSGMRARWLPSRNLLIQQSYKIPTNGAGNRILRMDTTGRIIEVLSDQQGLAEPEPNDMGEWAAYKFNLETGLLQGIMLNNINKKSVSPSFIPFKRNSEINGLSNIVWSPDNKQIAVTAWMIEQDHSVPSLGILSIHNSEFLIIKNKDLLQSWPLFWNRNGIYLVKHNILLHCKDVNSQCQLLYSVEKHKRILTGVEIGNNYAVLLIRDLKHDPFEVRAMEIHKINLENGKAEVTMRLPVDVFISDIDWTDSSPNIKE